MTITRETPAVREAANKNFARAARTVNDWVRAGKDLEFGMLIEINRMLSENVPLYKGAAKPGTIRVLPKDVILLLKKGSPKYGREYAKPERVISYLWDFLAWYQASKNHLHPLLLAAAAQQQLVRIHPFSDANGRTTRLIMDFILQRNGYVPASFSHAPADTAFVRTERATRNIARGIRESESRLKVFGSGK